MPFQKGYKPPHQFSSTHQPAKKGRKPAIYKQLTAQMESNKIAIELSREDFNHLQQWVLERNKVELQRIVNSPQTPVFLVNMVSAIIADTKSGNFGTIERILERLFGKPKITADIESGGKPLNETTHVLDLSNLTDKELELIGKLVVQNQGDSTSSALPELELKNNEIEISR